MSWTRGLLVALAVGALLGGSAGCASSEAHERKGEVPASPVGKVLDGTDEGGRHYREIDKKSAPQVAVEVQPASGGAWDVRLTVRHFRFSPPGVRPVAVAGRGTARLYLDGHALTRLRTPDYHLPGRLVPRGTHHVTVRLYADDQTVWAVHGKPVESTADITVSGTEEAPSPASGTAQTPSPASGAEG
ncbi:hypothetical protein ACFYZE_23745 [Streptomyces sp. NPDC001796]|uniref:hypothetical protein n=1 Tax=Streptomyces sp. NPDC001796 TaxID=3364609 RepID=UPI0036C162FD